MIYYGDDDGGYDDYVDNDDFDVFSSLKRPSNTFATRGGEGYNI